MIITWFLFTAPSQVVEDPSLLAQVTCRLSLPGVCSEVDRGGPTGDVASEFLCSLNPPKVSCIHRRLSHVTICGFEEGPKKAFSSVLCWEAPFPSSLDLLKRPERLLLND